MESVWSHRRASCARSVSRLEVSRVRHLVASARFQRGRRRAPPRVPNPTWRDLRFIPLPQWAVAVGFKAASRGCFACLAPSIFSTPKPNQTAIDGASSASTARTAGSLSARPFVPPPTLFRYRSRGSPRPAIVLLICLRPPPPRRVVIAIAKRSHQILADAWEQWVIAHCPRLVFDFISCP